MEETDMPDKVLSEDVATGLISLMYTLNTGVCEQDEESGVIYSASYIKSVKTKKGDRRVYRIDYLSSDTLKLFYIHNGGAIIGIGGVTTNYVFKRINK